MSPKGYATALHHGLQLQASSIYLFFTFASLLAFLKFVGCELFIFCSNFIQGFISRLQSSVAYIVHLSHIFKTAFTIYSNIMYLITVVHKIPFSIILQWITLILMTAVTKHQQLNFVKRGLKSKFGVNPYFFPP